MPSIADVAVELKKKIEAFERACDAYDDALDEERRNPTEANKKALEEARKRSRKALKELERAEDALNAELAKLTERIRRAMYRMWPR
jgi:chromosome segregation ATPase